MRTFKSTLISLAAVAALAGPVAAAQCGNNAGGFNTWKAAFAGEAKRAGVGDRGLSALANAKYATGTIKANAGL